MKIYRCHRPYLASALGISLIVAVAAAVGLYFVSPPFAIIVGTFIAAIGLINWLIRRTYRFTIADGAVRTEKLFTKDIDVTTPIVNIQSVSAYEGIIEALCGVGTVEISTASSNGDHATFRWPFLAEHRKIVAHLKSESEAARRRT